MAGSIGSSRTQWAESHVERFIAPAFVAEFVFRNLQTLDRGLQREVADFLVVRKEQALLVSQKCQDDPGSRTGSKLQRWAQKHAEAAVAQLRGALRKVGGHTEIWCDHRRRGRVSFSDGLPGISHAIATVEVFERIDLHDHHLPLEHGGVPISYFSVSDFMHVCQQLRTVPEVARYLDARRSLPKSLLLSLGAELTIFGDYLLFDGDLSKITSFDEADRILNERSAEVAAVFNEKTRRDRYSMLLEHVADQLAGRHPEFQSGLSQAVIDGYEPVRERRGYLAMQDVLAGLTLGERAELGRAFDGAVQERMGKGGAGFTLAAAMVDSQPDLVVVLGSFGATANFTRNDLLSTFDGLTRAAMAHYGRNRCLLIVDREGESYEVGLNELASTPSEGELQAGRNVFGALKISTRDARLRPAETRI